MPGQHLRVVVSRPLQHELLTAADHLGSELEAGSVPMAVAITRAWSASMSPAANAAPVASTPATGELFAEL